MKLSMIAMGFILTGFFAGCSSNGKKVLIMASGDLKVDEKDPKNIQLQPGSRHTEKEIVLEGGDKQTLTVQTPQGNKNYDVNDAGHYVLNLKDDTLIGSIVRYGTGERTSNLTAEDVDHIIDSTQKLLVGQNASEENKTYFLPPFTIKKISEGSDSRFIGPYNGIPATIDVDKTRKGPEMYKFFTNKQKRESLEVLIKERKK